MSFLSKISNIRKSVPVVQPKANAGSPKQQGEEYQTPSLLPKNYTREEDPAVRRLKERRQQELLKRGELSKKASASKKSSAPRKRTKKSPDEENRIETKFKKRSSSGAGGSALHRTAASAAQRKLEPLKKMSFEELMKQAENNAQGSGTNSGSNSPAKRSPEPQPRPRPHVSKPGFKNTDRRRRAAFQEPARPPAKTQEHHKQVAAKEPKPVKLAHPRNDFAKPNDLIRRRLESKRRAERSLHREQQDHGSDMEDFIEDDESEDLMALERDPGYDRDEIWALFNRGKRRSDYSFDDEEEDDMEANEREIIEEEERARKMAKIEDKREEEWLKRHEEGKKRRKRAREGERT